MARNIGLNKFIDYLLSFRKITGRLNVPFKVINALSEKTYEIIQKEPN